MKKRVIATILSLMVAAPMLFGCDMSGTAAPAASAPAETAEAVEETAEAAAEEVAEAVEETAEAAEEAVEETAEAAGEMKKMDELTEIKIFITDS